MSDHLRDMMEAYARFREALQSDSLEHKQDALMSWYGTAGDPLGEGWKAAMIWAQYRTGTTQN